MRADLVFFLFLSVFIFSVRGVFAIKSPFPPTVSLQQITTDGSQQSTPSIFKDTVVWTDWRNSATSDLDIFKFDLKTNTESPLLVKPGQQWVVGSNGSYIVYNQYISAEDPKSYDVHAYNLKTGEDIAITDENGSQEGNDIEGQYVTYIDGGACGKLYVYDLKRKTKRLITDSTCTPARIWDQSVVFHCASPQGTNVCGYDLKKNTPFDIATADSFQESPDIYENSVVWLHRDGNYNAIYLKDLKTGIERLLHETSSYAMNWPAVSKRYVVWSKSTAQHVGGVEGIDLKTGLVFEVQEQGPHQNGTTVPAIWQDTAVWQAWRTGGGDIYAAEFGK